MTNELSDEALHALQKPSLSLIHFARAVIAADRALRQGDAQSAKDAEIAELKSQKPELRYIDALGRGRYNLGECEDGVARFVMGGGTVYWPLSPEDNDRLHQSCCGKGRFDGPNVAEIAALKAELQAEQSQRFEGNRISSEEHAAEIVALKAERDVLKAGSAISKIKAGCARIGGCAFAGETCSTRGRCEHAFTTALFFRP